MISRNWPSQIRLWGARNFNFGQRFILLSYLLCVSTTDLGQTVDAQTHLHLLLIVNAISAKFPCVGTIFFIRV